jgi:Domain of unknown function (DUF1772)
LNARDLDFDDRDEAMRTEPKEIGCAPAKLWRFSLISTAVTMTAAVAHLMELPAKMRYEPSLYVRLHRTLYTNFGRFAGPAEIAAAISANLLAWRTWRERPEAFRPAAVAAGCLAAAHAIFWSIVQPVNVEMIRWPLDAIPRDWTKERDRWEYGHAIRAGLVTTALGALAATGVWANPPRRSSEVGVGVNRPPD